MRCTTLAALSLLAGCAAGMPEMRIATWDLPLEASAGRAALRQRVAMASQQLCAAHAEEWMPIESRDDPHYCLDVMRSDVVAGMTPDVRRAYWRSLSEAGMKGRGL